MMAYQKSSEKRTKETGFTESPSKATGLADSARIADPRTTSKVIRSTVVSIRQNGSQIFTFELQANTRSSELLSYALAFVAVHDPSPLQIVGRELDPNAVPEQDADVVLAHLA